MPYRGDTPASTTSRTIFAVEKIWFSTGTRTARPRPVRTLSCRLKMHHAIVAATNHARNAGDLKEPEPRRPFPRAGDEDDRRQRAERERDPVARRDEALRRRAGHRDEAQERAHEIQLGDAGQEHRRRQRRRVQAERAGRERMRGDDPVDRPHQGGEAGVESEREAVAEQRDAPLRPHAVRRRDHCARATSRAWAGTRRRPPSRRASSARSARRASPPSATRHSAHVPGAWPSTSPTASANPAA